MNQSVFIIENDVPFPEDKHQEKPSGPKPDAISQAINSLKVGESVLIPDIEIAALSSRLIKARGRNFALYTYRSIGLGARVWRKPLPDHILNGDGA